MKTDYDENTALMLIRHCDLDNIAASVEDYYPMLTSLRKEGKLTDEKLNESIEYAIKKQVGRYLLHHLANTTLKEIADVENIVQRPEIIAYALKNNMFSEKTKEYLKATSPWNNDAFIGEHYTPNLVDTIRNEFLRCTQK